MDKQLKDNYKTAKITIVLFWLFFALFFVFEIILFSQLFEQYFNESYIISTIIQELNILQYITLSMYLICGFSFVIWIKNTYSNLNKIKGIESNFSPSTIIYIWFIPIINIIIPMSIFSEINSFYKKFYTKDLKLTQLIYFWGFLFFLYTILVCSFFSTISKIEIIEKIDFLLLQAFTISIQILGLFTMIKIIKNISTLEQNYIQNKNHEFEMNEHLIN